MLRPYRPDVMRMAAIDIQPRRTAMHGFRLKLILVAAGLAVAIPAFCLPAFAQNPAETTPPEHKRTDPQQVNPAQQAAPPQQPKRPTAAELSAKETVGSALVRNF